MSLSSSIYSLVLWLRWLVPAIMTVRDGRKPPAQPKGPLCGPFVHVRQVSTPLILLSAGSA